MGKSGAETIPAYGNKVCLDYLGWMSSSSLRNDAARHCIDSTELCAALRGRTTFCRFQSLPGNAFIFPWNLGQRPMPWPKELKTLITKICRTNLLNGSPGRVMAGENLRCRVQAVHANEANEASRNQRTYTSRATCGGGAVAVCWLRTEMVTGSFSTGAGSLAFCDLASVIPFKRFELFQMALV